MSEETTVRAPDSGTPSPRSSKPTVGSTFGRYRIERELGAGGMGVVYAAFDTELERRVALKVIREHVSREQEERLLREARAMARLTHPNVVAVYDVGSIAGSDYIAMEMVDGESLVDWLRNTKPALHDVIEAFVAAGRGLAAAHEAGVVHRDFKPHNILRDRRGRIAVTDFGLAREAGASEQGSPASRDTPSSLSGLTASGALLGTPGYMAPEQWECREVSPATDQFAFCVALWEGLAGKRPFAGRTIDELRELILLGPDQLDASVLPRRLRPIVLRGLAIDPDDRWPSINALLSAIQPRRRLAMVVAGAAAATAVATIVYLGSGGRHATAPSCEPPALDPAAVWPATTEAIVRAGNPQAADHLSRAIAQWQTTRDTVCAKPAGQRTGAIACLDKVMLRIDALRRARMLDLRASAWGVVSQMYSPEVCLTGEPPHMPDGYSDAAVIGLAIRSGAAIDKPTFERASAQAERDACARAYLAFLDQTPRGGETARDAARLCGDDQAYAAALMNLTNSRLHAFLDPELPKALRDTERAVKHAAQPFLTQQFMFFRAMVAIRESRLDDAVEFLDRATGSPLPEFDSKIRFWRIAVLNHRHKPGDCEEIEREAVALRPGWHPANGPVEMLDALAATARWCRGDVAGAHSGLLATHRLFRQPTPNAKPVQGVVVDDRGRPVSGAIVAAGVHLVGDSAGVPSSLYSIEIYPLDIDVAVTDADGTFELGAPPPDAFVVAQHGTARSLPRLLQNGDSLVIAPTTAVRGKVRARPEGGELRVHARVVGKVDYVLRAPVASDGTFEVSGLPIGKPVELRARLDVASQIMYGAAASVTTLSTRVDNIELEMPSQRELTVIVRSEVAYPLHGARVSVLAGKVTPATFADVQLLARTTPVAREVARVMIDPPPAALANVVRDGDVLARVRGVPVGTVTACANGLHITTDDPTFWDKLRAREGLQPVRCATIDGDAKHVVIEVPPMKRLD